MLLWIGEPEKVDLGEALEDMNQKRTATALKKKPYRSIGVGAQILRDLGVRDMRLLSSPIKFNALSGFDLNVTEYVSAN